MRANLRDALIRSQNETALTLNGAITNHSTLSYCLDFFSLAGAMRYSSEEEIVALFSKAFSVDRLSAMKILMYLRDCRASGMGERNVSYACTKYLAKNFPEVLRKNIHLLPEYGRWDDLLVLLHTNVDDDVIELIKKQLNMIYIVIIHHY